MDNEQSTLSDDVGASAEDKSLTFRKRRLSLTNLRQLAEEKEKQQQQQQQHLEHENQGNGEDGDKNIDNDNDNDNDSDDPFAFQSPFEEETPQLKSTRSDKNDNNDQQLVQQNHQHQHPQEEEPKEPTHTTETEAEAEADAHGNGEEKAHSFRKRRLSLTHKREDESSLDEAQEPPQQRRRRNSEVSQSSMESGQGRLKSRTVHAAELLAHPPPSPSVHQLYQQKSAPPQRLPADAGHPPDQQPKWKKRHTRHLHEDERTLPFPRDIVGTFSCHGVEPIYEEDYVLDDDDEDNEWLLQPTNGRNGVHDPDKPTTAAKINQDRGGVAFPYGNCARTALFAVYDGHGQGGELVAQYALHEVQRRLEKHLDFEKDIETAFKDTFLGVDESLKIEKLIEPLYAGTTACVALLREQQLVLANAGDSRAVMARRATNGSADGGGYVAVDLTKDQNPDLPEEQARIEKMGGFVSPPPEPGLSARVWLDADCTQIGLAMARSIGDHAVKEVGVIAEPVVSFHDVTENDEFVIFATDGVWEFISSEEAVKVVADNLHRGATRACQSLIETAAAKWHEEEGDYRDDITALVVRLPLLWKSEHAQLPVEPAPAASK